MSEPEIPRVQVGQHWRLKANAPPARDPRERPERLIVIGPNLWFRPGTSFILRGLDAQAIPLGPLLEFGCDGLRVHYELESGPPRYGAAKATLHRLAEALAETDRTGAPALEVDREDLRAALGRVEALDNQVTRLFDELADLRYPPEAESRRGVGERHWRAVFTRDGDANVVDDSVEAFEVAEVKYEGEPSAYAVGDIPYGSSPEAAASLHARQLLSGRHAARRHVGLVEVVPPGQRLRAELALDLERLRQIVEGRTTPPTDAEILAQLRAHGWWLLHREGERGNESMLASHALGYERALRAARAQRERGGGDVYRWHAIDQDGRPCAWPVDAGATSE